MLGTTEVVGTVDVVGTTLVGVSLLEIGSIDELGSAVVGLTVVGATPELSEDVVELVSLVKDEEEFFFGFFFGELLHDAATRANNDIKTKKLFLFILSLYTCLFIL